MSYITETGYLITIYMNNISNEIIRTGMPSRLLFFSKILYVLNKEAVIKKSESILGRPKLI